MIDTFLNKEWDQYNVTRELVLTIFKVIDKYPEHNHIEVKLFDVLRNYIHSGQQETTHHMTRKLALFEATDSETRLRIIKLLLNLLDLSSNEN